MTETKNNYLLSATQAVAKRMIESGEKICPIEKWGDGKTLFVSMDKEKIFFTQKIEIDGREFFIGTLKK